MNAPVPEPSAQARAWTERYAQATTPSSSALELGLADALARAAAAPAAPATGGGLSAAKVFAGIALATGIAATALALWPDVGTAPPPTVPTPAPPARSAVPEQAGAARPESENRDVPPPADKQAGEDAAAVAPVEPEATADTGPRGPASPGRGEARRKKRTGGKATKPEPAVLASPTDDLDDLRQLQRARAAVNTDPARALRLLRAHRARFKTSPWADDRSASEITALCKLGRDADASKAATAFLRRRPKSALARAMSKGCQ